MFSQRPDIDYLEEYKVTNLGLAYAFVTFYKCTNASENFLIGLSPKGIRGCASVGNGSRVISKFVNQGGMAHTQGLCRRNIILRADL
jgi:hypothetical protein